MNYKQFQDELLELLTKHGRDLMCFIFGITYMDEDGNIRGDGCSLSRVPPEDHEEQILRDDCAKKASDLVRRLVENTYLERGDDE